MGGREGQWYRRIISLSMACVRLPRKGKPLTEEDVRKGTQK